jgi:hypothetical protein
MSNPEDNQLAEISKLLTVMFMSASCSTDASDDDVVVQYHVKTGSLHRIVGLLAGAGYPVRIPSNMPVVPAVKKE